MKHATGPDAGGGSSRPAPLEFKPDLDEAARRWDAFYAGDVIDRPVVCVTAPRPDMKRPPGVSYRDKVFGDIDDVIDRALGSAEATYFGGEAVPAFSPSFGPDEVAAFCGAELVWSDDSPDTNWSKPLVTGAKGWDEALPLGLRDDSPLWRRMQTFLRRAAERMAGRMLVVPLDLHTNMDLLMALRGSQALCLDLIDRPGVIDRAMARARAVFGDLWRRVSEAGRMAELGYVHTLYSMEGAACLQCDFSCMMSPEMFRRWVLPALEEEAGIVRHAIYHWDGPGALVHADDLIASRGLHTLSYVPGDGGGSLGDFMELFKKVQRGGKAVHMRGSVDQVKEFHRHLRPEKTLYCTSARSPDDAERLLEWFARNT